MNLLLSRSAELQADLNKFLSLKPFNSSSRLIVSRILCGVSLEHAESTKLLLASGNFTSAVGLIRLQYESLVRAIWTLYVASDSAVNKLTTEQMDESTHKNEKIPMLAKMLQELDGKAPVEALKMLLEFKQYSWKPLSSFIHGGIHTINRNSKGYPVPLLDQALKTSNGVSLMAGQLLVILSGDPAQKGKIPKIQIKHADCLPPLHSDKQQT